MSEDAAKNKKLKREHGGKQDALERRKNIFIGVVHGVILFVMGVLAINIGVMLVNGGTERHVESWQKEQVTAETEVQEEEMSAEVIQNAETLIRCGSGELVTDYAAYCELDEVERPVKRNPYEVRQKLARMAEEDVRISEVCRNMDDYPDNMLEALANNPEMVDFVLGYQVAGNDEMNVGGEDEKNAEADVDADEDIGLTEAEKRQEYPLFLQWDPRWGYNSYGDDSNVGLAGCGPVSLSMALYYLMGDESLTPDKIASYAMENDYYMFGTGTLWALVEDVPRQYGIGVENPEITESAMRQVLDDGGVLVCAMRPGDFTAIGHFIVIYGYDENGFLVSDPNCVARSRRAWEFEKISWQIKQLWSLKKTV